MKQSLSTVKRLLRFLRHRSLFSLASLAFIIGLILQLTHHQVLAHWILGGVAIFEVMPLLYGMWQDIRSGSYGVDILAATTIVSSVLLHQTWAGIVVVLMLTGGESLEDYAEHRSRAELNALLKRAPQTAHVIRHKKTLEVEVAALHIGDKILIKPGELVPADAVILEGRADFDEASLTGESLPQERGAGDQILSGSINSDGAITAKVTALAEDSQYQQIIKLVRGAAHSQAPFVRLADRYSIPFTITAFAIASAVWIVTGHAIRFLEVIVVATPCPLLLAAPIALISGMSKASKYGVIVKTGSALERLAEAETMAFDKTGTLTSGQLKIASVTAFGSFNNNDVLALAASLEQSSNHVLAQAIVTGAVAKKVKLTKAKHVREVAGRGVIAQLKNQQVLVGRLSLMEEYDVVMPKGFKTSSITQTAAYIAVDQKLAGIISLQDELRPETKATLDKLRQLGVTNMIMITGDSQASAQAIANSLQIDSSNVYAEMLPADKLRTLELVKNRPLVFVGDGVNDAPALTASDVGIAMGARGSTAASESADVVIMTDDLSRLATAVTIAQRTFTIARQSILAGITLSLILMLIFATGKFPPLLGAVLQEVVDVVVIFNALRAHTSKI